MPCFVETSRRHHFKEYYHCGTYIDLHKLRRYRIRVNNKFRYLRRKWPFDWPRTKLLNGVRAVKSLRWYGLEADRYWWAKEKNIFENELVKSFYIERLKRGCGCIQLMHDWTYFFPPNHNSWSYLSNALLPPTYNLWRHTLPMPFFRNSHVRVKSVTFLSPTSHIKHPHPTNLQRMASHTANALCVTFSSSETDFKFRFMLKTFSHVKIYSNS
jgi:hypothetical protein